MSRLAEVRRSVEDYRSAELITGALQDISSVKMQELRGEFEQNTRFFSGIREVYTIVKAHVPVHDLVAKEEPLKLSRRDIYVGLTSNKRFFGTLNRDIVRALVSMVGAVENSDFLMIGLTGAQYLKETEVFDAVARIEFVDDRPNDKEMQRILSMISKYGRVFVVYPKFVNPFRQDVAMTDITQTPTSPAAPETKVDYIFEPEIPGMVTFFEAQVRRALFERVVLETELARVAARTMKMRNAKDRAGKLKNTYEQSLRREFATIADIELMETFTGFNFWKQ